MNRAEEDALIERAIDECSTTLDVDWRGAIRLAIRAAVAAERKRCARICDRWDGTGEFIADALTAAIRRGE